MTAVEPLTWTAPCEHGHDADWSATPNTTDADYDCRDCAAGVPPAPLLVGPAGWNWRAQLARSRRWTA